MKQSFYLYQRRGTFYLQDSRTKKQQSLETKDRKTALRLLEIKRQAAEHPAFNQIVLKTCLATRDPLLTQRTWANVMEQMKTHGRDSTRQRCARAMSCKQFAALRNVKLVETTSEDFLEILTGASVSVAHYLKRLHNLALGLGWISLPVLAPKLWSNPQTRPKRGITLAEHQKIIASEKNVERNRYYRLLWEIGSSQSDAALLTADNIDWNTNSLSYARKKTGEWAQLAIGKTLAALLKELPVSGSLFPTISKTRDNARSAEFYRRCKVLKIEGISLHSYRYAWAERAKTCGYPERFAQEALGHNSKAVHRAYARRAVVMIPPMENFETKLAEPAQQTEQNNPAVSLEPVQAAA